MRAPRADPEPGAAAAAREARSGLREGDEDDRKPNARDEVLVVGFRDLDWIVVVEKDVGAAAAIAVLWLFEFVKGSVKW